MENNVDTPICYSQIGRVDKRKVELLDPTPLTFFISCVFVTNEFRESQKSSTLPNLIKQIRKKSNQSVHKVDVGRGSILTKSEPIGGPG
jgi:hypothetical protein